ncbi:MAG: ribonuclease HIII [Vampirovibrionales bacterium]|nr:ribonuclease HIII [Vampirovibrionales bacterium]
MGNSIKLSVKPSGERQRIKQAVLSLSRFTWGEKSEQYCDYRLDGQSGSHWARLKQFTNGTLYVEASDLETLNTLQTLISPGAQPALAVGAAAQQQLTLNPTVADGTKIRTGFSKAVSTSSAEMPKAVKSASTRGLLDITGDYIGTDESGKGDYFGPLVIAGVCVTDKTVPVLLQLGVMDSKKLTDKLIGGLALKIIETVGESAVSIVEIGPKKYNALYETMKARGKNLNHMLAWGHATVIENLLGTCPDCTQAIADQFGNEMYIKSQLKEKGKGITLYQTPRAEANVGVAAASILARHRFVNRMRQLSDRFGVNLPKGASGQVKAQARVFVSKHGKANLGEVAKLHFKTTLEL